MNKSQHLYLLVIVLLTLACSSTKNTFTNRMYHNTTSRYNAYFYAYNNILKLEEEIEKNHKEDYSQVLPVFFPIDSATIEQNEELLTEVRDFSSKAIEWHRISKWVDDNYLLLGMADYYEAKFDDASNTFRYLNVNSKKRNIRHRALIQLLKQFIDLRNYDDATYVIDFLSKESRINKENRFLLYKTLAYYYETREDVNGKIGALDKALDYTKDRDERSRLNFILAQLYQREELDALAYSYYLEANKGNPPYERSFFSQLFAQQVAEINKSKDVKRVRSFYDDLYKDSKNRDLRDVILFEKALFELKQDELEEAETLLIRAAKEEGQNEIQKGYIYQKLSEISFDIKKDFRATKFYLDSAIANFRPSHKSYVEIMAKKPIFDDYVTHYDIINNNDSLIRLAQLSPEEQELVAEQFIAQEEARLIREAEAKENQKASSSIFDNLLAFGGRGSGQSFYFDNAVAMQQGNIDFYRNWGGRPLEDNWRRNVQSFQSGAGVDEMEEEPIAEEGTEEEVNIFADLPDKESLLAKIPKTEEQINGLKLQLEEAYFELGKLMFFDFKEPLIAKDYLENLITSYPNSNKKAEAYYILYLTTKELGGNEALYTQRLNREFPDSPYTYSVNNPGAMTGNQAFLESSRNYKEAYDLYYNRQYQEARNRVRNTLENYPLTKNTEKLMLLDIMVSGKIDDTERYKSRLENYIQTTEDAALVKMARNMLKALTGEQSLAEAQTEKDTEDSESESSEDKESEEDSDEGEEDSPYRENPNQTHIFVIALDPDKAKNAKNLLGDLESFHSANFSGSRLRTGNMNLSREESIFIISPFNNAERALAYRDKFMEDFKSSSLDQDDKEKAFLISIENFQELNKRKNLNEYRQFYKKAY
ncbi:outer membrane protein assembly factor BamD [Arthrospiribacter ruber]|uniref:Gliding motility protein n=1 Tax=Arthrospiribacter ruber TaxID=2487934 RepID=A0A951IUU2_9BACT|nr:outer membrane protein assembly factor BamD [Arthrospiribacter ruber]MBW3467750.1 gliding motility protein [Arthrospiribacter ruber]